jgi:hypothetical protein
LASPLSRGTLSATLRPPGEAFVRMAATLFTLQLHTSTAEPALRANIKSTVPGSIFPAARGTPVPGRRLAAHCNNHEAENESDPPGLSPASNSNGSLPQTRLPEASKRTSKFLNMFVNCKEIYMEFMHAVVEFMRRLRDGLNGEADER